MSKTGNAIRCGDSQSYAPASREDADDTGIQEILEKGNGEQGVVIVFESGREIEEFWGIRCDIDNILEPIGKHPVDNKNERDGHECNNHVPESRLEYLEQVCGQSSSFQ